MENSDTKDVKGNIRKIYKPNIISKLFLCWMCPVLLKGNKRDLNEDDLIDPGSKDYDSAHLGDKLEGFWLKELEWASMKNKQPSLWRAIRSCFWVEFMPGAIFVAINTTARSVQPLVFSLLLSYWSVENDMPWQQGVYYALAMLSLNFVSLICQHHNQQFMLRFGLKVRLAASSMIYRKILRMSNQSLQQVPPGKIVNILSNDMVRFDFAFMFMHYLWLVPLQVAAVLYFMYTVAGWAPFIGFFSVLFLIMPLQATLTKFTAVVRRKTAVKTDDRIKLMTEIINGIQVIKMYAWEIPFGNAVKKARDIELKSLRKGVFIQGSFGSFLIFTERASIFLTMVTMALTGNLILATTIYPIQQFFNILQNNFALMIPLAISSISEMFVTIERIKAVLMLDEREDLALLPQSMNNNITSICNTNQNKTANNILAKGYTKNDYFSPANAIKNNGMPTDTAIELLKVHASWSKDQENVLKNISMRVRRGKLYIVAGSVGAGKTSLLQTILNELPINSGTMSVNGSLSYSCQESWLFAETVRENILFGLPYESQKYRQVCRSCCLLPDFEQFPYGDLSLVGERGVSLSGGQRARINLARAVYRDADIYLLDDPLSAVDANVGRQLFEHCIKGYLSGRTCVLITHQVHFLKDADYVVVLNEGSIEAIGTYDELISSTNVLSLIQSTVSEGADDKESLKTKPGLDRTVSKVSVKSADAQTIQKEQLQAAEERAKGNLKWEVFSQYLFAVKSWPLVALTLFAMLLTQSMASTSDYWISFWTNQVDVYLQELPANEEPDTTLQAQVGVLTTGQYIIVQGCLVIAIIFMAFGRLTVFVAATMRASYNLHNIMFESLSKATMRFFDTNPSGRVLNRFSKDMGATDEILPRNLMQLMQLYLVITSVLVLNALSLPWTLIPTLLVLTVFVLFLKWYLNAGQAVKRLEGTTKSPVFGMITSTMSGMSTIRSSNSAKRLVKTFDDYQNVNASASFTYIGGASAFGLYLDMISLVYLAINITTFIVFNIRGDVAVGNAGLAISQSLGMVVLLQWCARFTSEFLAQMTSVERVQEYTKLPEEKNLTEAPINPPEDWPSKGEIVFENVYLQYSEDDPPVLKNVNFQLEPGWKVGIVGRTGAGKSSLISALFRLSNIQGSIKIDGIDTGDIPLKTLRKNISIIPQEPVLFSETIRHNLDPFDQYSDEEIWKCLEQVDLKEIIPALDFEVMQGGANFSIGQRQLVCLARALLRSNSLLVMDEATANVDHETDALIQRTIRSEFLTCTVLTIAHRLNTIMDSDRVIVMDGGQVAEFDHPYVLLMKPDSKFNSMVRETGDMSKSLLAIAKKKYEEVKSKDL